MRRGPIACLLAFVLVFSLLPLQTHALPPNWDVLGTQYEEAVHRLVDLGILNSKVDGAFGKADPVTRAEFAVTMVKALGANPGSTPARTFSDVSASNPAATAIGKVASLGILTGDDSGTFRPNDGVTYGEAVGTLVRMLGYEPDVTSSWPIGHVLMGRDLGLTKPLTKYEFAANITRGELALAMDAAVFQVPVRGTKYTLSQAVHRKAVRVAIYPDVDALVGGTVQLKAMGMDAADKPFELDKATWSLAKGTGTLSAAGTLRVQEGPVVVRVSAGGYSAERTYQVISGLRIDGVNQMVKPGDTVTVRTFGLVPGGKDVQVPATLVVASGNATISADGRLKVNGAGTVQLKAVYSGLETTVTLTAGTSMQVSPATSTLFTGETVALKASVEGTPVQNAEWSILSGDGSITRDGKFTAGQKQTTIQAKVGTVEATAVVDVYKALEVSGDTTELSKGSSATFTAVLRTAGGRTEVIAPSWNVQPKLAIIETSGAAVGVAPGRANVVATYRGMAGSLPIIVSGDPAAIFVSASKSTLVANGKSQTTLRARVVDSQGNTVKSVQGSVFFTLSTAGTGSFTAGEVALSNGEATTTYVAGQQAGSARVLVGSRTLVLPGSWTDLTLTVPTIYQAQIDVEPKVMSAAPGARATVSVTLIDQEGYPIRNNTATSTGVSLTATGPATLGATQVSIPPGVATVTTYVQSNGVAGEVRITGSGPYYGVKPATLKTVVTGPATKLAIRTGEAVKADNTAVAKVYVDVQDANGGVRTLDNNVVVTLDGDIDGVPVQGLPMQATTQNGVATFQIRSSKAGQMNLTARAANLEPAVGAATFVAGAPAKVLLTVDPAVENNTASGVIAADGGLSQATLRAQIVDSFNNIVTTATDAITFVRELNSNATVLPAVMTVNAVAGVAEIKVSSAIKVGSDTFRASTTSLPPSNTGTVSTQIVGVASKLQFMGVPTVPAGRETVIKVRVQDSQGYLVTGPNNVMVSLSSTSPTFISSGPQPVINGIATFRVKDTGVGTWQLSASATGVPVPPSSTPATFIVTGGAPVRIQLVATPDAVATDGSGRAAVTAVVVDEFGNRVATTAPITLTTDSGSTLSSYTLVPGGTVYLSVPRGSNQTVTVRGTVSTGIPVDSVIVRAYQPAQPARVIVEVPANAMVGNLQHTPNTIKVKVIDVNGNVATQVFSTGLTSLAGMRITGSGGTNTTSITNSGSSGLYNNGFVPDGISLGAAHISNGVATFSYTNTKAETVTLTPVVYYNGALLPAESATITTKPGVSQTLALDGANTSIEANGVAAATISVRVVDAFGNTVNTTGDKIQLWTSSTEFLNLTSPSEAATVDGVATFTLVSKVRSSGGTTTIRATSVKTGISAQGTITTDLMPVQPTAFGNAAMGGTGSTITSGSNGAYVQVMVQPRTSPQTVYVYVNGARVSVYSSVSGGDTITTVPANGTVYSGYIRYTDLGGPGRKEVRVLVVSPLGASPFSNSFTLTVQ